jgi:regulator of extracellular matrix RemA (YlzA/DUF370 family)
LIAVVILSAIVPTAIAQHFFQPSEGDEQDMLELESAFE